MLVVYNDSTFRRNHSAIKRKLKARHKFNSPHAKALDTYQTFREANNKYKKATLMYRLRSKNKEINVSVVEK